MAKGVRHDSLSPDKELVSPKRLDWLPVNLGSAADLGALLTLAAQNWVGACILGLTGLVLGVAQVTRSRGHVVERTVLAGVAAVAIGGVTFGFAVDRLIMSGRDGGFAEQARAAPTMASTTPTPDTGPQEAPEYTSTKSLLNMEPIGDGSSYPQASPYTQEPQKINGALVDRVLSTALSCAVVSNEISEQFQLDRKFRTFRATVGLTDKSDSEPQVKFVARVDGEDRASTVMSVGALKPLEVDVTGGFRVELHAEVIEPTNCLGKVAIAAWIDPMVTR